MAMSRTAPQPSYASLRAAPVVDAQRVRLADFRSVVEVVVAAADYPTAADIRDGVLVYRAADLEAALRRPEQAATVRNELSSALSDGPGIVVITGGVGAPIVDRASAAFERIIAAEREAGGGAGDHYAAPGANERVWNALEKFAVEDPEAFVDYYGCPMIDLVSLAWLGPGYQLTSQVNVVNPGGQAQSPHRDYHIGFMTDEMAEQYPVHAHRLSPVLTLQGAIAHVDTPVASGATMLLPHSHKYDLGYLAWRRPEIIDYFAEHRVQLDLSKGDLVFFNPAVFHGAGTNLTSDVRRMANLLQISSAMGRMMESVDRARMVTVLYPTLLQRAEEGWDPMRIACAVAASAEGYAFPTNLDRDPPLDGLTPPSQQDLVFDALEQRLTSQELAVRLADHQARRRTH